MMDIANEIFITYILPLIGSGLVGLITWAITKIKNSIENKNNVKIEKETAQLCVKAVEQMYTDLHGEEKLNKCLESLSEMLANKGITVSSLEMRILIEAAVKEMNSQIEQIFVEEECEEEEE